MSRNYKEGWLRAYTDKYIIRQESPPIFHFWVGMTVIAAALRRNVFIDKGFYEVYPNQYVFLIAGSAGCMKSASMSIGMKFIHEIRDVHSICGKMTTEGLTDEMQHVCVDANNVVKPDGSILLQADELSYLFGKSSYVTDLLSFLTAAYTGEARLDFLTRGRGLVQVRNPCPSILAGCTPEQMGEIFPSMTLASGFMGRVILVYGRKGVRVPSPLKDREMEEPLLEDLQEISELQGEMTLTDEANELFDSWYMELGKYEPTKDVESFFNRKHVHVLKAAMALSVSESNKLIITETHLKQAITLIDMIEADIPHALGSIGATQQANALDFLEGIIRSVYPQSLSHSVLLRRIYRRLTYGAQEFEEMISLLKEQDKIVEGATTKGKFYTAVMKRKKS